MGSENTKNMILVRDSVDRGREAIERAGDEAETNNRIQQQHMAVCLNSLLINQGAITDCINWVASRISTAPTPNLNVLPHPTFPPPAPLLSPPYQMPAGGQRPVVPQPLGGDPAATATVINAAPTLVDQTTTPTAEDGPDNTTITKTIGCPPRPMGSRFTAMKVAKTAAKLPQKRLLLLQRRPLLNNIIASQSLPRTNQRTW